MKASDYRARFESETSSSEGRRSGARAAIVGGGATSVEERREVIRNAISSRAELPTVIPALIEIVGDNREPGPVRGSALASLRAASFVTTAFAPFRADYVEALRELASDSNEELRGLALEVLSMQGDAIAREYLIQGLEEPETARLPAIKALQLLSYDTHGDYLPTVRHVAERSEDTEVKEEALRLLSSDPQSEDALERLLADRDQPSNIRRISATGLQALNPERFEATARHIVEDEDEYDEIRASCLSALAHVRDYRATRLDSSFSAQVTDLERRTGSDALRSSAEQFLKRAE